MERRSRTTAWDAVAHTLPYDAAVMGSWTVPAARFKAISAPVMVGAGEKTDDRLKKAARSVATAIPNARYQELAGQNHNAKPEFLVPALESFLEA